MDARTVNQAGNELASLGRLALQRLALSVAAALAAAPAGLVDGSLAVAFAVGAVVEAILALASESRRRALVASLAVHREAYLLLEVRRYGATLVTMESRRALAHAIASLLRQASRAQAGVVLTDRVIRQAPALAALGRALVEPGNVVEPTAVAACVQLLTDGRSSPLLNPALPRGELDRALRRIHAGIAPPRTPGVAAIADDGPRAA